MSATERDDATIELRVRRFDPDRDRRPHWSSFRVEAKPKMSVLDALLAIVEGGEDGATLGFRYSCRAGMCGSCAMVIDGRERLACRTRLATLGRRVTVEPLRSLPVLKDLLVDMGRFFDAYRAVDPYFVGSQPSLVAPAEAPAVVPPGSVQRAIIDQQIDCISCGACFSACPTVASLPEFLGPAALNRAYALNADERGDPAAAERRRQAVDGEGGVYACRSVGNCVTVCPVGVEPLLSIQLLRKHAERPRS